MRHADEEDDEGKYDAQGTLRSTGRCNIPVPADTAEEATPEESYPQISG